MSPQWITLTPKYGGNRMTFQVRHIIAYAEALNSGAVVYTNEYEHDCPWHVKESVDEIAALLA